jgi:hypothetical protein
MRFAKDVRCISMADVQSTLTSAPILDQGWRLLDISSHSFAGRPFSYYQIVLTCL